MLNVEDTTDIILHSDLGSQYTSTVFEDMITERNIKHSFSRKGNSYDNACIEPFYSLLKKEEVYLNTYNTFNEAWYNRRRRHSALDYKTPQHTRKKFFSEIEEAINNLGGQIIIYDTIDLQLARKP